MRTELMNRGLRRPESSDYDGRSDYTRGPPQEMGMRAELMGPGRGTELRRPESFECDDRSEYTCWS